MHSFRAVFGFQKTRFDFRFLFVSPIPFFVCAGAMSQGPPGATPVLVLSTFLTITSTCLFLSHTDFRDSDALIARLSFYSSLRGDEDS